MRVLLTLLLLASTASAEAQCPGPLGSAPSVDALLSTVADAPIGRTNLVMLELDGVSGPEAVLTLREVSGDDVVDHLFVFGRRGSRWTLIGRDRFDATDDQGTWDLQPGIVRIGSHGLDRCRSLLVVESESGQGGADPRWMARRTSVYEVRGGRLLSWLSCDTAHSTVTGPLRLGTHVTRELTLRPGRRVVVRRTESTDVSSTGRLEDVSTTTRSTRRVVHLPPPNTRATCPLD